MAEDRPPENEAQGAGTEASPRSGSKAVPDPEALVRKHAGWLRGWVAARLRGSELEEIDDLVQEIFLRALRAYGGLRDPEKFPAWLYRIAVNVVRDHVRRRARRSQVMRSLEDAGAEPVAPRGFMEDIESKEELERVLEALDRLPPKYRDPMILRHVENLSYREIAQILGTRESTVQVRMFRAREKLKRLLEGGPAEKRSGRKRKRDSRERIGPRRDALRRDDPRGDGGTPQ